MNAHQLKNIEEDDAKTARGASVSPIALALGGLVGSIGVVWGAKLLFRRFTSFFGLHRSPVSSATRDRALETLRNLGKVEMDTYLEHIKPDILLHSKVGPTEQCLTVDALADHSELSPFRLPHLARCEYCSEALRLYKNVKEGVLQAEKKPRAEFWLDPIQSIEIGGSPVQFDIRLQCDDPSPIKLDRLQVETGFGKVECENIERISAGDLVGGTYVARCVARPRSDVIGHFKQESDFCDWINVKGETGTGRPFSASRLVRFYLKPGSGAAKAKIEGATSGK